MSLQDTRNELHAVLTGVTGIGNVHKFFRWAVSASKFLDLFKDDSDKINGCMMTRLKTPEEAVSGGRTSERNHNFKIICIYGLKDSDESELYFQDILVEGICTKLRSQKTLCNRTVSLGVPQVEIVEARKFGNVLCHYAEITVSAEEIVAR